MGKQSEIRENSSPIALENFQVKDEFWEREMELVRREVIPYQWEILNDRVEDAAPSYCMRNFKIAGKLMKEKREKGSAFEEPKYTFRGFEALPEDKNHLEDKFYGFVFQDSDFSKWIEAVAYSLVNHPDTELEAVADAAIDVVCAAQQENGYLDTYYIINGMDKIFTNLRDHHELYCFGHLTEGAVAYYQATGKDKLLKAAMRFADFIADNFGYGESPITGREKIHGYPGHEIAEMALVRLYEVTGEEKYKELCRYFLDERGKQPYYFSEVEEHDNFTNHEYHQSHKPVREQDEAVGHAVRAVYLYSGMADMARLTGDEALWEACKKLWHSATKEKMYITGAVGATHLGEAFSFPFDLPNDTAYAETCASIGLMFWARRMLSVEADGDYADVMEQALYNTVLSGMALDGKSFFYVNPLEVLPEACKRDERKFHVKPVRQKWFGCACCPPNLARLLSSLPMYAYSENESSLFVNLYIGGQIEKKVGDKTAKFEIVSEYPWRENISLAYKGEDTVAMTLAVRIPAWSKGYEIKVPSDKTCHTEKGYYYVEGDWREGDEVALRIPVVPRFVISDIRVRENIGRVALMKGPVVYCLEEEDNGKDLYRCTVDTKKPLTEDAVTIEGREFPAIKAEGNRPLTFIPYYAWANRGENEMMVWVREVVH